MLEPEYQELKTLLLPLLPSKDAHSLFKKVLSSALDKMTTDPAIQNKFVAMAMRVTEQSGGKRDNNNPDYGHDLIINFRKGKGHFGVALAVYYLLHRLHDTPNYQYSSLSREIDAHLFENGESVYQALTWFPQTALRTDRLDPEFYTAVSTHSDISNPAVDQDQIGAALDISYNDNIRKFVIQPTLASAESRFLTIQDRRNQSRLNNVVTLLSWQYQLTEDVIGRDQEIRRLMLWIKSKEKQSVKLLHGDGGVGKTRLAFHFAKQLREKGWQAGECDGGFIGNWYVGNVGMLLIIDYPEENPEWVAGFLKAVAKAAPHTSKLRVLLLCRDQEFLESITRSAQDIVDHQSLELKPIVSADLQWRLFSSAWTKLGTVNGPPQQGNHPRLSDRAILVTRDEFEQWLLLNEDQATPLIVMALAVYLFASDEDAPAILDLRAPTIVRYLSVREENRIREEVTAFSLSQQIDPMMEYQGVILLKAIAAIAGGFSGDTLADVANTLRQRQVDYPPPVAKYLEQMSFAYQSELTALQPDILAADFLAYALDQYAKRDRHRWLEVGTGLSGITDGTQPHDDVQRNFTRLGRLSYDIGVKLQLPWLLVSFGQDIQQHPEQVLWVSNYLAGYRFIDPYLQQVLADATIEAAAQFPDDVNTARHLTEVARLSYERGICTEDAIVAAKKAIAIYDTLNLSEEDINPIIARNYYVFLTCMQSDNVLTEAEYREFDTIMQWASQAVTRLLNADRNPDHITAAANVLFTSSYLKFCDVPLHAANEEERKEQEKQESERFEQALRMRIESTRLFEELAKNNRRQYGGYYGSALAQLANAYQVNECFDKSIAVGQKACEYLAPFAAKDPGHWEFNYANLLYFQALRLAIRERIDESLPLHQQAITHYIHLYQLNPSQFSYHLLEAIIRFMEVHGPEKQLLLIATSAFVKGLRLSTIEESYPYPEFLEQFKGNNLEHLDDETLQFLDFLIEWTQHPHDLDYDTAFEAVDTVFKNSDLFASS